ncbi:hypothetical protein [Pedobacter sp. SYSU D00535]|uniref:hypothetical protein n=1 Tax=Pedobacter sp. SYSU D00535 TaxID=2810308 RepID=UPI001A97B731|nr:hypothetical protein [Pedobacter sp. SYSU D00535]
MQGTSFSFADKEVKTNVNFKTICTVCNTFDLKPLSGSVKGLNTDPQKPADQTKWLLDIHVVLGTVDTEVPVDTILLKQYFYPNFIYN